MEHEHARLGLRAHADAWLRDCVHDGAPMAELDAILRAVRRAHKNGAFSQAWLAEQVSVEPSTVSRWMNNVRPREAKLNEIVGVLQEAGHLPDAVVPSSNVFLSTPMASLQSSEYSTDREAAQRLYEALTDVGFTVYWGALGLLTPSDFEAPDLATKANLDALMSADAFVYAQSSVPVRPTSSLVELGMALAFRIPVTVFARREEELPYMLHSFSNVPESVPQLGTYRLYASTSIDAACGLIRRHQQSILRAKI